jgi:hypothetical protein
MAKSLRQYGRGDSEGGDQGNGVAPVDNLSCLSP